VTAVPRVSIAIPVYNGGTTIGAALESALVQTLTDHEVVVVDNGSTDDTVDVIRSFDDPRIRLHRNHCNRGYLYNHNRSVQLSRAELVKPLHADDELLPRCLERQVEVLDAHREVGFVFAPRRVQLADETDDALQNWGRSYGAPHRHFSRLCRVNDGRRLLTECLRSDLADNWVGEPSCAMFRRSSLERVGLFSGRVLAFCDFDLFLRLMAVFDVGFVDEELSVYRRHRGSLISELKDHDWLDRVWILEGLAADPDVVERVPDVPAALGRARRRAARALLRSARRRPDLLGRKLGDLARYAAYLARRSAGSAPALHPGFTADPS
jgi:glycosyltransferase involved in cell wall biosynthesis